MAALKALTSSAFESLLGGPLPDAVPLVSSVRSESKELDYVRQEVSYQVEEGEYVSASLLLPNVGYFPRRLPGIIVWHQHNGEYEIGRSEPVGLVGDPAQHIGIDFVRKGYIVLCPDVIGFESRQNAHYKGAHFERFLHSIYLMEGKCLAWKYMLDARAAVNYLQTRGEVDANRIGSYGHSLGSTISWMQATQDTRIKVIVGSCCLVTTTSLRNQAPGYYHSEGHIIPGIAAYEGDAAAAAAIIPCTGRKLHFNFGEMDPMNPVNYTMSSINFIAQQSGNSMFSYYIAPNVGHSVSAEMKNRTMSAFESLLSP